MHRVHYDSPTMIHDEEAAAQPRVIVAHAHAAQAEQIAQALRRRGWAVTQVTSGPAARMLARRLAPTLVVLDTDLDPESGWLSCDKLTGEQPTLRVLLVGIDPSASDHRLATFVGAASLVDVQDGLHELLAEVESMAPLLASA